MNNKNQGNANFRNINGEHVRRQYFDIPIILLFCVSFVVIFSEILKALIKEAILFSRVLYDLKTDIWVMGVFIIFAFLFKALNAFCFGEVLCTLTARGVHCKSGFFGFEEIVGATYHAGGPNMAFPGGVTLAVIRKDGARADVMIYRAPVGLLRQLKKHNCNIVTDFTLFTKETIIVLGLCTVLAPVLIAFLG